MARNRRVLVTRSAAQAVGLADALRALELEPVVIPVLAFAAPTSFASLDLALEQIERFDWLILTSANAAEAMCRRAAEVGASIAASGVRLAAVGKATAEAAREHLGLDAAVVSPKPVAESLATALMERWRGGKGGSAESFLVVRAEEGREVLERELEAAGAKVTVAAAYRTIVPAESRAALAAMAASGDWPAAVTFTSPSAARHLLEMLAAMGAALPREVLRISVGPVTSSALREMGIAADAEARDSSPAALALAVSQALDLEQL